MTTVTIRGVPVEFPFEPYDLQQDYMEKVIECLQNEMNGVLESPTGTGKTLSLLCSSLAWLQLKKAQLQAQRQITANDEFLQNLKTDLDVNAIKSSRGRAFLGVPTIIYASRTHSQLSQAMQELKRTSYKYMKAYVLGSREQMCIHPELLQEQNSAIKIQMCRVKLQSRSCQYYNRVDRKKMDPAINELNVIDIEDIVKLGETHKFCPYYMCKELKQQADIIFMPYNYLLDPKARKALGVELCNNVIILDEAHNIEHICEESASLQIKTTDIALAIEEVTAVMKLMSDDTSSMFSNDQPKDFSAEELCILKQMLLDFESELDKVPLTNELEGTSFEGNFIFELLEKANIGNKTFGMASNLIDKIIQFLTTVSEGPFQRKGNGLQLIADLLLIVFADVSSDFRAKVQRCFKVHIKVEEPRKKKADNWLSKATAKAGCRILSYWCFSPGFGMSRLMAYGVRSVILTSGTLAPLRPLISELELKVEVQLENPHIVKGDQVCVKIITHGPDMEALNCSYQNRDNPKYINSLGRTILNVTRLIPNGLLIFFPSYPIMQKFQQVWQQDGIWSSIYELKTIFVEPRDKETFNSTMNDYYAKIQDVNYKGAIFMGVCRGKVSEGLDFADANGRGVIVVGLPYPPLRDPKIILKKRYLDVCNARDKEYLKGDDWYSLEGSRAVNQAIGRVIRHRHDYGAILLLDSRFNSFRVKSQFSRWLRDHIKVVNNFGEIVRDLRVFFKNADTKFPAANLKPLKGLNRQSAEFEIPQTYRSGNFDFNTSSVMAGPSSANGEVVLHKRDQSHDENLPAKRKKITLIPNRPTCSESVQIDTTPKEYIIMVRKTLDAESFKEFVKGLTMYDNTSNFNELKIYLDKIFLQKHKFRYLLQGLETYIKSKDKSHFQDYWNQMKL